MKWRVIEIHVDGVVHRASYRAVGDSVELTTSHGEFRRPKGPFLPEITAREMLRKAIKSDTRVA